MAGQAHGVSEGDTFDIASKDNQSKLVAQVTYARPLTSQLQLLGVQENMQIGNVAKPTSCLQLANFPLRLAPDVPHRDKRGAILKKKSLCLHSDDAKHPAFEVILGPGDEYGIRDGSNQRPLNIPRISRQQTDIEQACDILEHLVRFTMVKEVGNTVPRVAFQDLFDIHITNNGKSFDPKDRIDVLDGRHITLCIVNKADLCLYAFVYNLGALWQAKQIQKAAYEVIPKPDAGRNGLSYKKKIKIRVPDMMREHGSCDDIIKVFITSQPTSFDYLDLPKLNTLAELRTGNKISSALDVALEDWAAVNFHIRIGIHETG